MIKPENKMLDYSMNAGEEPGQPITEEDFKRLASLLRPPYRPELKTLPIQPRKPGGMA